MPPLPDRAIRAGNGPVTRRSRPGRRAADPPILQRWDTQPHVVAADPNDDRDWEVELGRCPHWSEQLIVELDGRPLGSVQIIDPAREESRYWGDAPPAIRALYVWIGDETDLGKGYGTEMMHAALGRCFSDSLLCLSIRFRAIHAPIDSTNVWASILSSRRFGKDDCLVYRLSRNDWHNERLGSR